MPNTSVRPVESFCMPPKKSTWRFESPKLPEHQTPSKSQFVEPGNINNFNMGIVSNVSEIKPVDRMQFYCGGKVFAHEKREQIEDAPLDFSVKKCASAENRTGPMNPDCEPYLGKRAEIYEFVGDSKMVNHVPAKNFYSTNMLNGHNSPSSLQNNSPPLDSSHASSSGKDSDSLDMECSQESVPPRISPFRPVVPSANKTNEINQASSPDHRSVSRENSPVSQPSILEGMLKGQQQSNLGMPNGPTYGPYGNGMGVFENQILTSSSPPMPMGAPIVHPASMLPLTMAPYFGYGYVEQPSPFMQGYMYKPSEAAMIDVSAARQPKRKIDPFSDSLKSCTVEELQKKLEVLSGGNSSLVMNADYAARLKFSYSKQRDNERHFLNNASPEPVKNEINNFARNYTTANQSENGDIDNSASSQVGSNAQINHNTGYNTATGMKAEEINSQNTVNRDETNNANKAASKSDDADGTNGINDSLINETPETSDGRRRKSNADYRDDPNYKLKRAKNNMAARRSRESRRIKEELIRKTASILEQQNKVMVRDLTALKFTYEEAQMKYFALMKEYENMKIQNSVLAERLNQKRCGQCGSALPNVSSPSL